jgi:hypothetical protein
MRWVGRQTVNETNKVRVDQKKKEFQERESERKKKHGLA